MPQTGFTHERVAAQRPSSIQGWPSVGGELINNNKDMISDDKKINMDGREIVCYLINYSYLKKNPAFALWKRRSRCFLLPEGLNKFSLLGCIGVSRLGFPRGGRHRNILTKSASGPSRNSPLEGSIWNGHFRGSSRN